LVIPSLGFYADRMFNEGITNSRKYVEFIIDKAKGKNYKIINVAIMLEGKKPKLDEHIDNIKKSLSKILNIKKENIGIAATSGENMTDFGKGLGMQCIAAVLLKNKNDI